MDDQISGWQRWRGRVVGLVVIVAIVAAIWHFASHQVGVRRSAPRIATITPLPPPPPPPKEKPPEPKKVEETKQEIAKPNEPVKPVEAPKQAPDAPRPITIDGPAQAGNDSFNIGAGDGGGMVGSGNGAGLGGGSYEQYLGYTLQQAIQRDERTRRLVFDVRANLWISADGTINRITLDGTSGSSTIDQALIDALQGLHLDTPPPPKLSMPIRASMRGRRPS